MGMPATEKAQVKQYTMFSNRVDAKVDAKLHWDKLYPAPKPHLLDLVSQHLKPINYDRWAELYRKKQLESLSASGEKELDAL